MFKTSYKVATVWGIPIRINISILIIVFLFAYQIASSTGVAAALPIALVISIFLFTSIALHELGHSFVAIRKGCRVRRITLMFIGGAAEMENIPRRPMDEFQMAIAGPAVSFILGLSCFYGGSWIYKYGYLHSSQLLSLLGTIVNSVGSLNIWLATFNLVPAFPMDGGRVFRALLTPKFGRLQATFIASRLGRILAILAGITGIVQGHFMLVAVAFFIYTAADQEYRMILMQESAGNPWSNNSSDPWHLFTNSEYKDPDDNNDNDKVIISPPPYEKGQGSSSDIHLEKDENNLFKNFFGK